MAYPDGGMSFLELCDNLARKHPLDGDAVCKPLKLLDPPIYARPQSETCARKIRLWARVYMANQPLKRSEVAKPLRIVEQSVIHGAKLGHTNGGDCPAVSV